MIRDRSKVNVDLFMVSCAAEGSRSFENDLIQWKQRFWSVSNSLLLQAASPQPAGLVFWLCWRSSVTTLEVLRPLQQHPCLILTKLLKWKWVVWKRRFWLSSISNIGKSFKTKILYRLLFGSFSIGSVFLLSLSIEVREWNRERSW